MALYQKASLEVRLQPLSNLAPQCFCCHLFKREIDSWLISSFIYSNYEHLPQILHFGPKFGTHTKLQNSSADPFGFRVVCCHQRVHGGSNPQCDCVERGSAGLGLWILVWSLHGWVNAFLTGSSYLTQAFHTCTFSLIPPCVEASGGPHQLQPFDLGLPSPQDCDPNKSCFVVCLFICKPSRFGYSVTAAENKRSHQTSSPFPTRQNSLPLPQNT